MATEGASPRVSEAQRTPWSQEFAAAEMDAGKHRELEPKPIFHTWRSQRNLDVDEPSPSKPSEASNRGDFSRPTALAEQEGMVSPLSSATSGPTPSNAPQSLASTTESLPLRQEVPLVLPPRYSSPLRPTRFAREVRGDAASLPAGPLSDSAQDVTMPDGPDGRQEVAGTTGPCQASPWMTSGVRGFEGLNANVGLEGGGETGVPRFLRMFSKLSARDDSRTQKTSLDRTRSGWLKAEDEGTSLRSLHAAARRHMGVSIPAVAYPLGGDGNADTSVKPQPVTLFFGIIDFLQLYNLRKWNEHWLKSIVSDGNQISVTNPKAYSRRFMRQMQTLFIPIPDPGIDDAMAIACAFNSPELVDIIGLTTIFGNVLTPKATENAFFLLDLAGRKEIPVAEGSAAPLSGVVKAVASFVHGDDGFGNTNQTVIQGKTYDKSAALFLADAITSDPGNVSVLALGPLTNIAMAFQSSPDVARDIGELVILGGAFEVEGNVNPAGEANILGDPEAADIVFGQTDRVRVVGLDVTHTCQITESQLQQLQHSKGRFGPFLYDAVQFYLSYYRQAYGVDAIFAHDPTAFLAVIHPELFEWREGPARVICEGFARGKTMQDPGRKKWNVPNGWTGRPKIKIAVGLDVEKAVELMLKLMCQ